MVFSTVIIVGLAKNFRETAVRAATATALALAPSPSLRSLARLSKFCKVPWLDFLFLKIKTISNSLSSRNSEVGLGGGVVDFVNQTVFL